MRFVMAGLDPAIHVFTTSDVVQDVDARVKLGHDEGGTGRAASIHPI